ncbi:hypothetical protein HC928_08535 [bacterium]|nr:hypothetical protein [bacterium]
MEGEISADSIVRIGGIIHGINLASDDYSLTLIDGSGPRSGIGLFISDATISAQNIPLDLVAGDSILVTGNVGSFNGLMQIQDVIALAPISRNNPLRSPATVDTLNEDTESRLILLENISIDSTDWQGGANNTSGFNVSITLDGQQYTMAN